MTLTAPPSNRRSLVLGGIYRILVDYHGYPAGYTQFVKRMAARGMDKARVPLKLSSLKAIAGTIFDKPFEHWPSQGAASHLPTPLRRGQCAMDRIGEG